MHRLVLAVSALAALVTAPGAFPCQCGGCPPSSCGTTSSAAPGSGLLTVRTLGPRGSLDAFDVATGRRRFSLPAGVASADGTRYVTSTRSGNRTWLRVYDARRARPAATRTLAGGWNAGGLSANGRWAALTRPAHKATRLALVDLEGVGILRPVTLPGWFDVDAVANDGRRLFLIQYVKTGYLVRLYDVRRRRLAARSLTEKGIPMAGTAWGAVAAPDGHRLLTLYLRDGAAEVHTLDLVRGTAVCIDLPRGALWEEQQYALALSPDGRTLYAASAALGTVATVDLVRQRVMRTYHFGGRPDPEAQSPSAAVSHDGRTVYFTAGRKLYAYDAAFPAVRGSYDVGGRISGLAFSRDDTTLLVVRRDLRPVLLSGATGEALRRS